jgi:hypothetical protein
VKIRLWNGQDTQTVSSWDSNHVVIVGRCYVVVHETNVKGVFGPSPFLNADAMQRLKNLPTDPEVAALYRLDADPEEDPIQFCKCPHRMDDGAQKPMYAVVKAVCQGCRKIVSPERMVSFGFLPSRAIDLERAKLSPDTLDEYVTPEHLARIRARSKAKTLGRPHLVLVKK